jgi:PAS domain S-box-containing protein
MSLGQARPEGRTQRARILVVDDDPAMRRVVEMLLSGRGWVVETATDGRAALHSLQDRIPDLVIMDVVMPGVGGLGALRKLRAEPRTRRLPIILMSVISEDDSRVKALEAGASDYLIKPFSERELLARVITQLDLADHRRAAAEESESLFRTVADHAPVLISMSGTDGLLNYVNQRTLEFSGLTSEELMGHGWVDMVHPEDRLRTLEAHRIGFQSRRPYELEARARRRDGEYRWMLVSGAPRFLPTGDFAGFVVSSLDITERKRREEERIQGEAELRAILDGAIDAVVGVDTAGRITFWNPRAEQIFGRTAAEAHGRDLAELLIPARFREAYRNGVQHFLASGEERLNRRMEVAGLRRDGSEFPAEVTLIIFRKADRSYTCTAFVADITERKHNENDRARLLAEAEEARTQAESANRMKDEFLATLSHELRTPLNAIVGWVHLLRAGRLDEATARRALETIDRNAKVQTQLIADILDVSRIVSGKLRVQMRPLELAPIVEAALDTVRLAAEAKGIRIALAIDPLAGPVLGDPDRLQQVVWNLLSNAIKFTPDGGRVQVALRRDGAQAVIWVSDNGIGIAPEFLPFVFERFRQADASSTRPQGGLGLGLAIVRHLAEIHGGLVTAESAGPGRGAVFTLRLPLVDLGQTAAELRRIPAAAVPEPAGFAGPSLEGVSVLLVDDEEASREATRGLLSERGADVSLASSAEEALELIGRLRPDVLLTRLNGRGEESHRLIRAVREIPPERGGLTPAAVLSQERAAEDRMKSLLAGYQIHLAQPVEPLELTMVVASLAGRTRDLFA